VLMDKKAVETWMGTAALAPKAYVGIAALRCPPNEAHCPAYCAAAGTSSGVGVLVAAVFRLATPGASSPRK